MNTEQNPYDSPAARVAESPIPQRGPIAWREKRAIISICLAGALLTAVDVGFLGSVLFAIWAPAVVFIVATLWTYIAASRESSLTVFKRVGFAAMLTIVLPPAAYYLLVLTCTASTDALGVGFRLHGGARRTFLQHLLAAGVTFALTLGIALVIYALLSFPFRRPTVTSVPKDNSNEVEE